MRKLNFEQIEMISGGQAMVAFEKNLTTVDEAKVVKDAGGINWCRVGGGISGIGTGLLIAGATLSGGVATAIFGAIVISTALYCY